MKSSATAWALLALWISAPASAQDASQQDTAPKDATHAVATVLGKNITLNELDEAPPSDDPAMRQKMRENHLRGLVWSAVFADYAKQRNVEPTAAEIESHILNHARLQQQMRAEREQQRKILQSALQSADLASARRAQLTQQLQVLDSLLAFDAKREVELHDPSKQKIHEQAQHRVATHWVRQWKLNQVLYREFGGRIVFQQAGWEPIDAYRQLLTRYLDNKKLRFAEAQWQAAAFSYFEHRFVYADETKARFYFEKPYWERTPQEMKTAGF